MTSRLGTATGIWHGRQARDAGDRAYLAYSLVLLALVVVTPIVRAVWLQITTTKSAAALVSPSAGVVAGTIVFAIWAAALTIGQSRGPAVAAPFLVHVLVDSDLRRRTVFRSRIVVALLVATVVGGGVAVFVGLALESLGLTGSAAVLDFTVRGALVGVVAAVLWLVGQSVPRVAGMLTVVVLVLAVAVVIAKAVPASSQWAWVSGAGPIVWVDVLLLVLAAWGVASGPWLLDRISDRTLTAQAARWDAAIAHAVSLDFGAVAESYQTLPTAGRGRDAITRRAHLGLVILVRDLVGATRMPARLSVGVLTVAGAGAVLVLAAMAPAVGPLLSGLAAILLYSGVGAFSRGLQHAALVSRDRPLYGIGDGRLLVFHSFLPIGAALVLTGGTAIVLGAFVAPASLPRLVWGALALPVVVVAAHLSNALRGPAPLVLMTPAPSAVGDPMPLIRVLWALDAPVLAVLAGMVIPIGGSAIGAFLAVSVVLGLFLVVRCARRG